ncbi:MAG TPA: single-stranded DNA-binding protein [Dehalococcoidia bacterium]
MLGLNEVTLLGRLGADPELRFTANGKAVCELRLAVPGSRTGDGEPAPEWVTCVAWEALAEACAQHLTKGSRALVRGRLATQRWEGKDGQPRSRTVVVAGSVLFLDARSAGRRDPDDEPLE